MATTHVELTSARLVLRRLADDDAEALARIRSDPEVAKLQSWDPPFTEAHARTLIADVDGHRIGAPGWAQLGIERIDTGNLIGDLGVNGHDQSTVEVGYTMDRQWWGLGYGTEAVGAMVDHLLGPLGFGVVTAEADPINARSVGLLRRLGFTLAEQSATSVRYAYAGPERGSTDRP